VKPLLGFRYGDRLWRCRLPGSRIVGWGYTGSEAYREWQMEMKKLFMRLGVAEQMGT
jgi:hypothetical protein